MVKDPGCLVNLINDPALTSQINEFRTELQKVMEQTNDHQMPNYRVNSKALLPAAPIHNSPFKQHVQGLL
ncbi:MAG TPA: hypothetical protein VF600_02375 [Abditibacteriaceae bacterium]|jgi:hypothetical protein